LPFHWNCVWKNNSALAMDTIEVNIWDWNFEFEYDLDSSHFVKVVSLSMSLNKKVLDIVNKSESTIEYVVKINVLSQTVTEKL